MHKRSLVVLVVALFGLALAAPALASHSWGSYHWARTANPLTLKVGDNVTPDWDSILDLAIADWDQSTKLSLTKVAGQTRKNCRPTSGRIEVCNGNYGFNGWLGLAQIWVSGSHITQAVAKMNDSYLSSGYTTTNKRHVMCQEVGHDFGLAHQDESGADLNTCMDYANALDNPSPNAHDYEQLDTIYTHLDSTNTAFGPAPADTGAGAVWVSRSHKVEHLGGGFVIHTFVLWAK